MFCIRLHSLFYKYHVRLLSAREAALAGLDGGVRCIGSCCKSWGLMSSMTLSSSSVVYSTASQYSALSSLDSLITSCPMTMYYEVDLEVPPSWRHYQLWPCVLMFGSYPPSETDTQYTDTGPHVLSHTVCSNAPQSYIF